MVPNCLPYSSFLITTSTAFVTDMMLSNYLTKPSDSMNILCIRYAASNVRTKLLISLNMPYKKSTINAQKLWC